MFKNGLKAAMVILAALLLHKAAFAAEGIDLPPEELARESVLPIFDKPVSVKNRAIVTEKRFEADVFYGYAMTEAIANVSKLGVGLYYNTNEKSAWGLLLEKNFSGLSNYAEQLDSQYGLKFDRAPAPEMTAMLDYNLKAFYGKMSLTKSWVLNTILYGSASGGIIKYQHKTYPAIALGIGQKFYFGKNWSLRADFRVYGHQAPVPFLNGYMKDGQPVPSYDQFEDKFQTATNLDIGLSYLF
jgi:outer membrane beta-barrel protein